MLQITFRHMDSSSALRTVAEEKFERLRSHFTSAPRCHVVVEDAPGHARKGGAFSVHVELSVGGEDLHLAAKAVHPQAASAVREAFECLERQIHTRANKRAV